LLRCGPLRGKMQNVVVSRKDRQHHDDHEPNPESDFLRRCGWADPAGLRPPVQRRLRRCSCSRSSTSRHTPGTYLGNETSCADMAELSPAARARSWPRHNCTRAPAPPSSRPRHNTRRSSSAGRGRAFGTTKPFALGLGPLDAGLTALSDQLALELSDAAHDREHEAPHVARGVSPGVAKGANLCTSVRSKSAGAYRERRIRCISCGLAILRPVLPRCGDATGQQLAAGLRATGREAL
jgi:hypothetical protein